MAIRSTSSAVRESQRFLGDRIIRGGALIAAATVVIKLSSFVYKLLLGWFFAEEQFHDFTDSHFYAFGIVMMVFGVAQQTVAPAFLPVFAEERKRNGREAWQFASGVLLMVLVMSAAAATAAFLLPGAWVRFSDWIAGKEATHEASALLKLQVSYVAPAFIGVSASVVTYMILNAHKRFFWAQVGEAGMRLTMIVATVGAAAAALSPNGAARVLGLGVAVGSGIRVLTHVLALGRKSFLIVRPRLRSDAMKRFLLLAAPLVVGSMIAQGRDLINNNAIMFSLDFKGLVSANNYGRSIANTLDYLIPFSVGVAMFPYFCDLVDKNDLAGLGRILTRSGRVLMLGFFALAGPIAVMSRSFSMVLFPKLPADTIALVALANACYVAILPALAIEKLLMQGFFANRRMISPTVIGIVFSFISVGVSIVGIRYVGLTGAQALATVAIGYAAARYLKVVALAVMLRRTVPIFPARETAWFLVRAGIVAGVCAGSAWLVKSGYETWRPVAAALEGGPRARLVFALPEIAAAGAASIAAGLAAIRLLRMEELGWVADWIRRKRGGGGAGPHLP